ncbi:hypothetical protein ACFE04_031364 [Oxalis oulophora]
MSISQMKASKLMAIEEFPIEIPSTIVTLKIPLTAASTTVDPPLIIATTATATATTSTSFSEIPSPTATTAASSGGAARSSERNDVDSLMEVKGLAMVLLGDVLEIPQTTEI